MDEADLVARMRQVLQTGQQDADFDDIVMRLDERVKRLRGRRLDCNAVQLSAAVRKWLPQVVST